MNWVIAHLKSTLRREKMFGSKHTPLAGDPKYNASATFSKERIPQLTKAIEVLEQYKEMPVKEKKESKKLNNQLTLWKNN